MNESEWHFCFSAIIEYIYILIEMQIDEEKQPTRVVGNSYLQQKKTEFKL